MLNYFVYYFLIIPVSVLPYPVLYALSDFFFLIVYYIIGYRKEVVRKNLKNSFPERTDAELRTIEKKYYSHMCDLVVESLKNFTISRKDALSRMVSRNPELAEHYYQQGRSIVMLGAHYNNWELFGVAIAPQVKHDIMAVFTPLKNKFMNTKATESRGKFGLKMLSYQEIKAIVEKNPEKLTATIFASDQSPRKDQNAHWMTFLNQDTGVQFGGEKFARDNNMVVITGGIYKVKRGFYEFEYEVLCENPNEMEQGQIMERFMLYQEKIIKEQPEYWLWSHKRWKHKKPATQAN